MAEEEKTWKALSVFDRVCFTMTNYIKGIDGCNSVWCNSSSHTTIYCNYTPARKAGADPQHSKWSMHNWTPLLNGLENSIYKCMSEEEAESEGRSEETTVRVRESENLRHESIDKSGQVYYRSKDASVFHSTLIPALHALHQVNWYECVASCARM